MRSKTLSVCILSVASVLAASSTTPALAADAVASRKFFDIPAQTLGQALKQFAEQTGLQLAVETSITVGHTAPAVKGELSAEQALERLLQGSGLRYDFLDSRTVAVSPATTTSAVALEKTSLRLAQADTASSIQTSTDSPAQSAGSTTTLEEIVVTAQKKSERLQDVPIPVTAVSADALVNSNQYRLQDYYTRIPGLSLTPSDVNGAPVLTIRGVTTGGYSNPTVGITVDDVSSGSSTNLGGGSEAPDLDPSELARVEVLRGPQGTLYGASSIGGLVKFVTVDPSTEKLTGNLQVGATGLRNGDGAGYGIRGGVNVPVSDTFALRVSGNTRRDPGYIDDPTLGVEGVNRTDATGGRLAALWLPAEDFSLKLSALVQDSDARGSSDIEREPGLQDLEQTAVRGTGFFKKKIQAYSLTAKAKLGEAELTSVSAYGITKFSNAFDYSAVFSGFADATFGVAGTSFQGHYDTRKTTQEIRLTVPTGERFDWLLGVFYTHERSQTAGDLLAADPFTGALAGSLFLSDIPTRFTEYAAFANLTWRITDTFDIQFGGRQSQNRQSYAEVDIGPLVGGMAVNPRTPSKDNSFTYLVTPRWRISPQIMAYARLASGYRAGGPNPNSSLGVPPQFGPDKTLNYELGIKGDTAQRAFSYDLSVYYIDWKDIQLQLAQSGFLFYTNASRAKSQGVEMSIEARPLRGLTIAAWVALNEAELTEDFPVGSPAVGVSGDRLPASSRQSGNLSLDEAFPIGNGMTGFVGGSWSYVGDRKGSFTATTRETLPSYTRTDLRAGVRYDAWAVNLFANNVFDKRGTLAGGLGTLNPVAYKYIQPRTIGVAVSRSFGAE